LKGAICASKTRSVFNRASQRKPDSSIAGLPTQTLVCLLAGITFEPYPLLPGELEQLAGTVQLAKKRALARPQ
jgi:hypothetical protein